MESNLPFRVPLNSILLQRIKNLSADLFLLAFIEIGNVRQSCVLSVELVQGVLQFEVGA
jgi:hypothetical protein